jgi:hypothetical protein
MPVRLVKECTKCKFFGESRGISVITCNLIPGTIATVLVMPSHDNKDEGIKNGLLVVRCHKEDKNEQVRKVSY